MNCKASFGIALAVLIILASSPACRIRNTINSYLTTVVPATENRTGVDSGTPSGSTSFSPDCSSNIQINGLDRHYFVHLPPNFNKDKSWPLVFCLHGGGGEGKGINGLTGYNAVADSQGFIVVYPDAIEHNWNDGRGDLMVRSHIENIDDVAFISALIDKLAGEYNIDRKMVYATGISNGALMSHRLGCELADKIAAIAPVAGNIPEKMAPIWTSSRPMPVLIINGTDDPLVPWDGGYITAFGQKRGRVLSVADTVKFWAGKNGCSALPETVQLPDVSSMDGTTVTRESYSGCRNNADVLLYAVKGGGHTWPGGFQYLPAAIVGKTCRDFNASEVIWEFFKQHPLK